MQTIEEIVRAQPLFAGLPDRFGPLVAACARNCTFAAGDLLFHEGAEAREFFLILEGEVALEIDPPGHRETVLNTVHEGDVVGASWLVPPHRWYADARARTPVRALGFDASRLRAQCDADAELGYALMQRFVPLLVTRLQTAHLQLLDLYGSQSG